jgi:hypothetical protein
MMVSSKRDLIDLLIKGYEQAGPEPFVQVPKPLSATDDGIIVVDDMTGESLVKVWREGAPETNFGTIVKYEDKLTAADGTPMATAVGWATVYMNPNNNRAMQFAGGTYSFEDGDVSYMGIVYIDSAIKGEEQSFPAFGVSGRYKGRVGSLSYQLDQEGPPRTDVPLLYKIRLYLGLEALTQD